MARVRDWYKRNLLQSKNMETKMMGLQLLFFLPWSVDVIKKIRRNERGLGCGLNARNCVFLMGLNDFHPEGCTEPFQKHTGPGPHFP